MLSFPPDRPSRHSTIHSWTCEARSSVVGGTSILLEHSDDCLPPLIRFLDSAETNAVLHLETVGGKNRHIPSGFFPDQPQFDTEHLRPADRAPPHGTIGVLWKALHSQLDGKEKRDSRISGPLLQSQPAVNRVTDSGAIRGFCFFAAAAPVFAGCSGTTKRAILGLPPGATPAQCGTAR